MNISSYTFLAIILLLAFACKKDLAPISGCTDDIAVNYNPNAITDDGLNSYLGLSGLAITEETGTKSLSPSSSVALNV